MTVLVVAALLFAACDDGSAVGETGLASTMDLDLGAGAWLRVPHDEEVFGGDGDQLISSVTVGGPGLVAVGFERSLNELENLGKQTLGAKYDFKVREGFDLARLRLPRRIMETTAPTGAFDEAFMRRALEHFASEV